MILEAISLQLQAGQSKKKKTLVRDAVDQGIAPETILDEGLIAGMNVVGARFKNNEIFVPEVFVAACFANDTSESVRKVTLELTAKSNRDNINAFFDAINN